ncbi:energy-coupling factor transporter transmembrane component T family protein [Candidatus Enterococcus ferrettii]|uniref:Energy-coupling factor transport system permease n=1 Tax=Candidatus Enterococcus ferrettii TaxID=2815324 RepID=A0ABV0EQM5_9ENTE|nr:energy-coupling factor transporter transmembrane component T [Enterococcus sp. 665A]MBO1339751.1 energy-coupling factor transporter transmembrane protein EcfT [Enterococcus sp. 665A]
MNSFIGRLYPSTKFLLVLVIIILSMFTPDYRFQLGLFAVVLFLSVLSNTLGSFLKLFVKSIVLIVLFIFLIQVFIIKNPDSQPIWAFVSFSQLGLATSIDTSTRIIAISSSIIWFFQATSVKDIIHALELAKVSKKVTFVIASTIQLVPQMSKLSQTISDAQKSRGIETEGSLMIRVKAFVPMMGPLVLSSIQQTEERVLTLESRGFSSTTQKTSIYAIKKSKWDYLIAIGAILIFIIYLVWRNQ